MKNLYSDLPSEIADEVFEQVLKSDSIRIDRIVSHGQVSPDGFWYDQSHSEWVAVLQGAARVLIEGEEQPREMNPGDFINIPAHRRHRVEWTDPEQPTVWLAVHYD